MISIDADFDNVMQGQPLQDKSKNNAYQDKWESRGSVRTRPRKIIDFSQYGYFFPEDKQPILLAKEISLLGQKVKEEILLQSFFKYLYDIVNLEIKLINSACSKILYGDLVVKYDDEVKLNTYSVMVDEYYHVYVAEDMRLQLNQKFPQLKKFNYPPSDASQAVMEIKNHLEEKYHDIFEILAVCIFETTLVRELVEFFNSENVHPSIKCYVNDHMNDESRHFGFFYEILVFTWEKMPEDYKENIGKHLAKFIKLYLNVQSDKEFYSDLLTYFLKSQNEANVIVEQLYIGFNITPEIPIVKNVINVLRKSGLLENIHVKASFKSIGWSV